MRCDEDIVQVLKVYKMNKEYRLMINNDRLIEEFHQASLLN